MSGYEELDDAALGASLPVQCPPSCADLQHLFSSETKNVSVVSRVAACATFAALNGCDVSDLGRHLAQTQCRIYQPLASALAAALQGDLKQASDELHAQTLFTLHAPTFARCLDAVADLTSDQWSPEVRALAEKLFRYTVATGNLMRAADSFNLPVELKEAIKALCAAPILRRGVPGQPFYAALQRNTADAAGALLYRLENGETVDSADWLACVRTSVDAFQGLPVGDAWIFVRDGTITYQEARARLACDWGFSLGATEVPLDAFRRDFVHHVRTGDGPAAVEALRAWQNAYDRAPAGLPPDCYQGSLFCCGHAPYRAAFLNALEQSFADNEWRCPTDYNVHGACGAYSWLARAMRLQRYEHELFCSQLYGDPEYAFLAQCAAQPVLTPTQRKTHSFDTQTIEAALSAIGLCCDDTLHLYLQLVRAAYLPEDTLRDQLDAAGLFLRINIVALYDDDQEVLGCRNALYPTCALQLTAGTTTAVYDSRLVLFQDCAMYRHPSDVLVFEGVAADPGTPLCAASKALTIATQHSELEAHSQEWDFEVPETWEDLDSAAASLRVPPGASVRDKIAGVSRFVLENVGELERAKDHLARWLQLSDEQEHELDARAALLADQALLIDKLKRPQPATRDAACGADLPGPDLRRAEELVTRHREAAEQARADLRRAEELATRHREGEEQARADLRRAEELATRHREGEEQARADLRLATRHRDGEAERAGRDAALAGQIAQHTGVYKELGAGIADLLELAGKRRDEITTLRDEATQHRERAKAAAVVERDLRDHIALVDGRLAQSRTATAATGAHINKLTDEVNRLRAASASITRLTAELNKYVAHWDRTVGQRLTDKALLNYIAASKAPQAPLYFDTLSALFEAANPPTRTEVMKFAAALDEKIRVERAEHYLVKFYSVNFYRTSDVADHCQKYHRPFFTALPRLLANLCLRDRRSLEFLLDACGLEWRTAD